MKPEQIDLAWCVVNPEIEILFPTVRKTGKEALFQFELMNGTPWLQAEQLGFRLQKISIKFLE